MSQNNPNELGQILLGILEVFGVNILVMFTKLPMFTTLALGAIKLNFMLWKQMIFRL
jgi:hypothetical protein